jgi:hypothetical protein
MSFSFGESFLALFSPAQAYTQPSNKACGRCRCCSVAPETEASSGRLLHATATSREAEGGGDADLSLNGGIGPRSHWNLLLCTLAPIPGRRYRSGLGRRGHQGQRKRTADPGGRPGLQVWVPCDLGRLPAQPLV